MWKAFFTACFSFIYFLSTSFNVIRDLKVLHSRRLSLQLSREGRKPCKQQAYSISTHRDPRTSLAKAGMGMDGNHANSTNSHMTARLAQHRRGGDRNPYRNSIQHTAYNGTPGRLSLQREWGWMETMETALAHINT